MKTDDNDIARVAAGIQSKYGSKLPTKPSAPYGWSHPVLNLLDCILSLNRRYYSFAKPRVEKFKKKHRDVVTLQQLKHFIDINGGPAIFFTRELDFAHAYRANILYGVLNCLINIINQSPDESELTVLNRWATSKSPKNFREFGIEGFGLAGFQYLRMLYGADTVKPDLYIKAFVKDCLGRSVSDMTALNLVETATQSLKFSPRDVDGLIWAEYEKKKTQKSSKQCGVICTTPTTP